MKKSIAFILVVMITNINYGQKQDLPITLKTSSGDIYGSLLLPPQQTPTKVALIIAGSGPTDRNGNYPMGTNNSLKLLAEGLYDHGIASVRYDKRGIAESKAAGKQESEMRFQDYVEDVVAWIDLLQKDPRFSKVMLVGHSEGSLIGLLAAQQSKVTHYVSLAGAGQTAGDLIREQLKEQPPVVLEQAFPILDKLENGELVEDIPQMLFPLFRPSVQPYMISWFAYDPQSEISKLDCPILIIQGTTDIQIKVKDAEQLHSGNPNAKLELLEGMNHVLKSSGPDRLQNLQTYSNPDLPLFQELVPTIVSFVHGE
nr:alpha/beta fold hydrolase [Allomuricauda sp.]